MRPRLEGSARPINDFEARCGESFPCEGQRHESHRRRPPLRFAAPGKGILERWSKAHPDRYRQCMRGN